MGALLVLAAFWLAVAWGLRNRPWARRRLFFRKWLLQHAVMCVVILLYFLYTTTTRELISLFSCQQVDDPARLPIEAAAGMSRSMENPAYSEALLALPYQSSSWTQGYWTSDTRVRCSSPVHLGLVIGLGIPGVLLFGLGLPIGLWVMLSRINKQTLADGRCRLEDPEVGVRVGGFCRDSCRARGACVLSWWLRHVVRGPMQSLCYSHLQILLMPARFVLLPCLAVCIYPSFTG